ncbi:hypothetical protein T07_14108 [Trichinella nelsoni]|uniref:Uncharacterized protein n=1 Tax=Trichinella nelsoni TaxID=6336 RepID=A0A0V0S1A1_9BILA|nr:hypothetical protein T07_14108 [Trichinella nelsoni]
MVKGTVLPDQLTTEEYDLQDATESVDKNSGQFSDP